MLAEEIFRQSRLQMSSDLVQGVDGIPAWDGLLTNRILIIVSVLAFLINIPNFLRLMPSLLDSLSRARANYELEHSVNLSRLRNISAAIMFPAICLMADRYALAQPSYMAMINPLWHVFVTMGLAAGYLLLRHIMFLVPRPQRLSSEAADTVHHTLYTYAIVLGIIMLASVGAMHTMGAVDASIRSVLTYETVIVYLLAFMRTGQILSGHCSGLSTILYLCALELVPLAILLIAAVVV